MFEQYNFVKSFANGGIYCEHIGIDKEKADYKLVKNIGIEFAKMGEEVKANTEIHFKSAEYPKVFGLLLGTKYERKCPDLTVGIKFYEVKSFVPPMTKRSLSNMFSKALSQSNNIVAYFGLYPPTQIGKNPVKTPLKKVSKCQFLVKIC